MLMTGLGPAYPVRPGVNVCGGPSCLAPVTLTSLASHSESLTMYWCANAYEDDVIVTHDASVLGSLGDP
ncbi:hypothetical protein CDL15_Pgr006410 [Punica granatum]|uniref:Uncharacterized protein n=1 Tax=Punica granatum TaxID=22663 RepID=A0A218Y0T1_PUNGR|nr:hypothetical protein CDL15_Pgr006410 [Punica granatum]